MLNIFVNTWGNYNENGADGGKWLSLPMEEEEFEKELEKIANRMGDFGPEWFVDDYEFTSEITWEVDENDNLFELNNLCQRLEDEDELEKISAIIEADGCSLEDALENKDDYLFYENMTLEEVAEEIINDCYDLPELALRYFDYEAFSRDLGFDGYTETEHGVIYRG